MRASSTIVGGCFCGGEIEPGTFHGGEIEPGTFHGAAVESGTLHGQNPIGSFCGKSAPVKSAEQENPRINEHASHVLVLGLAARVATVRDARDARTTQADRRGADSAA